MPGVPADYYRRILEAEERHYWYRGLREISAALLGSRLRGHGLRVLDAGCGTGGFLRWLVDTATPARSAGIDLAAAAIELARDRVPEADLQVAPLDRIPFPDASFDFVVCNDVLQHVPESDVFSSLHELRRVLDERGTLLVRTNGSRRLRRERDDWRAYDRGSLRRDLERAGFLVERITYANLALSLLAAIRGRVPHAPSGNSHGIPASDSGRLASAVGRGTLAAEARWVRRGGSLPYGHTLLALASRP